MGSTKRPDKKTSVWSSDEDYEQLAQSERKVVAERMNVDRAAQERDALHNKTATNLERKLMSLYELTKLNLLDTQILFDQLKRFEILPECVRCLRSTNELRPPDASVGRVVNSHDAVQQCIDARVEQDEQARKRKREHRRRQRARPASSGASGMSQDVAQYDRDPDNWLEVRGIMECVVLILEIFLGPKVKMDIGITHRDPHNRLKEKEKDRYHNHGYPMQMWAVYRFPTLDSSRNLEVALQALIKSTNQSCHANGGKSNRLGVPGVGGGGQNKRNEPHWVYVCFWVEE